jgi:Na+-driven multidrug efflux pump
MKREHWVPVAVFLGVSIPVVLILAALDVLGDHRVWIALGAGALATAFAQSRLKAGGEQQ